MFDRNGRVWDFERARQIVADKNPDNEEWIEEVAAQFRLSRNWTKILKAVGIDWPTKNLPAFRSRLSEIAMNESASVTERAMACEMLASSYSAGLAEADPEKYRE